MVESRKLPEKGALHCTIYFGFFVERRPALVKVVVKDSFERSPDFIKGVSAGKRKLQLHSRLDGVLKSCTDERGLVVVGNDSADVDLRRSHDGEALGDQGINVGHRRGSLRTGSGTYPDGNI